MPKKSKKHAMEMTDEEALKHLFHPEIVKSVRKHLREEPAPKRKPKKNV